MNFLLVNDDGIDAPGIRALADALASVGNIYVCAPDGQRSGASHSLSIHQRISVEEVEYPGAVRAWKSGGSPADCTKIGLQFCCSLGAEPDIVFSGINNGSNLGEDTLYSGTVGAAREAAMQGYRAIAVSVDSHKATHYEAAQDLAIKLLEYIDAIPKGIVINVNTPDIPKEEMKGVKVAKLGTNYFSDRFEPQEDGMYGLEGHVPDWTHLGEEFDVAALQMKYAVITPLHYDFTAYDLMDRVKGWEIKL